MFFLKKILIITLIIILNITNISYACNDKLIPSGDVVFIDVNLNYPFVVDIHNYDDINFEVYDVIVSLKSLSSNENISVNCLKDSNKLKKDIFEVKFMRKGNIFTKIVSSEVFKSYELAFSIPTVGTITAINSKGDFVGLSHSLKLNDTILSIKDSCVYGTKFVKEVKSTKGNIGHLIAPTNNKKLGILKSMNEFGVKGYYDKYSYNQDNALEVGKPEIGIAYIQCPGLITNSMKTHKIKIVEVNDTTSKIQVLDIGLIKFRGGLVKGMSGSPIIQNGKIVGGLRTINVQNPHIGYISNIDEMLK